MQHVGVTDGTLLGRSSMGDGFNIMEAVLPCCSESRHICVQVLVIVAASHLDAVTFQICSQSFKIMPTAVFAVWLLGQYLTPMQWASLPVLAVGVIFVTLNGSSANTSAASQSDMLVLGLAASALSGLSSAYAGAVTSLSHEAYSLHCRTLRVCIRYHSSCEHEGHMQWQLSEAEGTMGR